MNNSKLGWHWLRSSRALGYGDGRLVVDGETLTFIGYKPVPCRSGMHASEKITQALVYAPGCVLTRVEVSGDLSSQNDKFVGRHRKCLWSLTKEQGIALLVEFAEWCAVRAKQNAATSAAAYAAYADAADAAAAAYAAYAAAAAYAYAAATDDSAPANTAAAERDAQEQWWLSEIAKLRSCTIGEL